MKILLVCPARPGTRHGNRVTALRWARILRDLGHRVRIRTEFDGLPADLLVALHARKSGTAVERFRRAWPGVPVIVALTGTDLYRDLPRNPLARRTLAAADRLVVLQPHALRELPARFRSRARVIFQSAVGPGRRRPESAETADGRRRRFDVCVVAHLRGVKDPFRAARAARELPAASRIRVLQLGAAMTREMERRARAEERRNPRYRWLGDRPRSQVRRILSRARLLVQSSYVEGGANAISESLALGVPVLASRIPGNVGLLGARYPGYFRAGDTRALARLLRRAETDRAFYRRLARACERRAWIADPRRERAAWQDLLEEIGAISGARERSRAPQPARSARPSPVREPPPAGPSAPRGARG